MAEAAVQSSAARFFCHQCAQEVSPVLPDYLCSRCHSGFIEELAQPAQENVRLNSEESDQDNPVIHVSDVWNLLSTMRRNDTGGAGRSGNVSDWTRPGPSRYHFMAERPRGRRHGQETDLRNVRVEGFLQQFIQSLTESTGFIPSANFPVFVNLHGNPGDYAWGRGGWNAIITQLINQLDGTGPPPLSREKIEEIPTVNISQEQADKNLQCTVCMEDFIPEESVRLLSCQHHFHNDCIIPWLELHGTCPICRKMLTEESDQNMYANAPFDTSFEPLDRNRPLFPESSGSSNSRRTDSQSQSIQNNSTTSYRTRSPHNTSTYDFTDDCD